MSHRRLQKTSEHYVPERKVLVKQQKSRFITRDAPYTEVCIYICPSRKKVDNIEFPSTKVYLLTFLRCILSWSNLIKC